jgi:hypothetical protein
VIIHVIIPNTPVPLCEWDLTNTLRLARYKLDEEHGAKRNGQMRKPVHCKPQK